MSAELAADDSRERAKGGAMKALVYHGPGQRSLGREAGPEIQEPTDAIVRIDSVDDLRDRPPHPQGRRARGEAGHDPRPRGRRHRRRDRERGDDARAGRPRARLLHHLVRPLPLLQGGPLRPLHRRRRLDLRPPDRRAPGGVRAGAVRRHVRLQGAGRADDEQVLFLADILPTAYEVGVLNGGVGPATRSRSSAPARSGSRRS